MTTPHDLDRQLEAFLAEGPTELPDASFDDVRDRTESTRQRVVIGPWRFPDMHRIVPIGIGAAAIVVALVAGSQLLLPSAPGGVGAAPDPTPLAIPTPSPAPATAAPPSPSPSSATLPVGPFTIIDEGDPNAAVKITVEIPAPGWMALPEFGGLDKGERDDPPEAAILAWSFADGTGFHVYADPCAWTSTVPDEPATTVDDFAAALEAQASRDASPPVEVIVGGHAGKRITMTVPLDADFTACDDQEFATYGTSPTDPPNRVQQGPGQVDELTILDVDGDIVVLDVMYRPDTRPELIDELRAIVASATFE